MKHYCCDDTEYRACIGRCDNPTVTCDHCGDTEDARSKKGLFIRTRDGEDLCSPCYDNAYDKPEPAPFALREREF